MKSIALLIGMVFALGLQAQTNAGSDSRGDDPNTERVKISRFVSGHGISKEKGQPTEVKEIHPLTNGISEDSKAATTQEDNHEKKILKISYYRAGYKVDNLYDTGFIPKASTVLE